MFELTGGEASDSPQFPILLDAGPDIRPRAAMGDKGYDAKSNRRAARARADQSAVLPGPPCGARSRKAGDRR